ncbi:hexamethylene bisacetamide inducible [Brevipalpus obovatus]|uniref:hexamethylene bisacetamide inducible n=1 Tax=Brevipalpus obovatus TaxID=246614 RepID=UPI003D9F9CCE
MDKNDESDGNSKKIRRHRRGKWRRPRLRPNYNLDSSDKQQQQQPQQQQPQHNHRNHHHHSHHHQNRRFCSLKIRNLIDHPLAPFNTNQFLMDDHDVRMPEHDHSDETTLDQSNDTNGDGMSIDKDSAECADSSAHGGRRRCNSDCTSNRQESQECSSDEINSLPDEEYDFMQKQFSETYEKIHSERINSMSKAQLVEEYLLLERRCEQLESKIRTMEDKDEKNAQSR